MNEHLLPFQRGNESKMSSIDRMLIHQEWLKQQHEEIRQRIQSKIKVEEKPVIGFIKD
jgi:hypothetical protein